MTNTTTCNALLTFRGCTTAIFSGQTYVRRARAKCLTENGVAVVAVKVALPDDYDGEMYVVTTDGEENGGWFNSRKAARAHAAYLRGCHYDSVSVSKVGL